MKMKSNVFKDWLRKMLLRKENMKENFKEQKRKQGKLIKLLNKLNKLNQKWINQLQVTHQIDHSCHKRPKPKT